MDGKPLSLDEPADERETPAACLLGQSYDTANADLCSSLLYRSIIGHISTYLFFLLQRSLLVLGLGAFEGTRGVETQEIVA